MRPAIWLLAITSIAVAQDIEEGGEPWVEEEDLEEPYRNEREDHARTRKAYVDEPFEEQVRVRRRCCDYEYDTPPRRARRSPEPEEHRRTPRQVHQYEVYESTDDNSYFPSPSYEEMLAASAEHYHRVYAAPGAPASTRYLNPEVSAALPVSFSGHSVSPQFAAAGAGVVSSPQTLQKQARALPLREGFVAAANPASVSVNANKSVPPISPVQFIAPVDGAPIPVAHLSDAAPAPAAPLQLFAAGDQLGAAGALHGATGDQHGAAAGHHRQHKHSSGHAAGGGHKHHAEHHAEHGGKTSKGHKTAHWVDKGGKGHKEDENHKKEYEEAAGKKHKHHDHAGHKGGHQEEAHGSRGAHFDEKKGHKKGHKTKGYHNKYHKDEFHKEHKFYDDYHKSGEHHRYGKFHAKHASNESGKKKAHHLNAGHDVVERGKKGYSNKGHLDADHKGYKGGHGHEEHHEKHSDYGKKGGKEGGKSWGYGKQ